MARLIREAALLGVSRRKRVSTTQRGPDARPAPDPVERDISATAPDQLYVADIAYVPTWAGFLFPAIVLDACTRRVVGWAMANHLCTALVLDALNMALHQRRLENVIHHTDQGTQVPTRRMIEIIAPGATMTGPPAGNYAKMPSEMCGKSGQF